MTLLISCGLGLGLVLAASPWLWPAGKRARSTGGAASRLDDRLKAAGIQRITPAVFLVVSLLLGVALGAAAFALVPVLALGLVGTVLGAGLPSLAIALRARRRRRAVRGLWPDVVDHLVAAVRAGVSLPEAVTSLAHHGPEALRGAFAEFATDYETTRTFLPALERLADRLADPIADRILATLRMAREVGGTRLPSVLRSLAGFLREEAAIRGEVEARQSWVTNAAKLGAAAPWAVLLMLGTRPEAAAAYNSPGGVVLIVVGLVVTVVAYRMMRALSRLPEEGRWAR